MTDSEDGGEEVDPATFHDRLDAVAADLDAAETEADLDTIEDTLDALAAEIEEAVFPEPEPVEADEDEEPEEPPDPQEELDDRLDELRDELEDQRGPYADEVISDIEQGKRTIETTEWAEEADAELVTVVDTFLEDVATHVDARFDRPPAAEIEALADSLDSAIEAIEAAELHPDTDTPTIEALLDVTASLTDGIDEATAFDDLPVREQLHRRGFFDVLGHYKDFPPEWSAIKAHEEAGNVEMILLAFDKLDSNYLEDHCISALRRIGDERALEPMMNLARRRNKEAIGVLGKIASDEPIDMLLDYVDTDSDPHLQRVTMKTLGEIGGPEAAEPVAQQLVAEDPEVRSAAARALGMIGDPRAIEPLAEVLDADEAQTVRGSAAWALVEIGTQEALEVVGAYAEDPSFLVESEAKKAHASS